MGSTFETLRRLGPAAFVFKAILGAAVADLLLLGFILLRRTYRRRYFAKRDARVFAIRQKWDAMISGEVPYETWRAKPVDRRIIEEMVLDSFEAASQVEAARLLRFLRASGLIEKRIFEARQHRGWRRLRALVALGRTRAPEGIQALSEGLRDRSLETRLAALRGLGRMASPEAAEEILSWVTEAGLTVPALPLQSALIQCCAERPQLLLPHLQNSERSTREVLGRVMGEVATASLGTQLLAFVDDDLPELRAAAARALSRAEPRLALDTLRQLAEDSVWFVRLRAVVSLGKLSHQGALPALLCGLKDSNRLVRLRAAEALVDLNIEQVPIFEKVIAERDRYGLHAYLTALDNAGLQSKLETELKATPLFSEPVKQVLIEVLRTGILPAQPVVTEATASAAAAARP
jgi:HEAT repeat protein